MLLSAGDAVHAPSVPCQQKVVGLLDIDTEDTILVQKRNCFAIGFIERLCPTTQGEMRRSAPAQIDCLGGMEELHPQNVIQIVNDTGDAVNNESRIGGSVFNFTCA